VENAPGIITRGDLQCDKLRKNNQPESTLMSVSAPAMAGVNGGKPERVKVAHGRRYGVIDVAA
jgi:hypothetical protein